MNATESKPDAAAAARNALFQSGWDVGREALAQSLLETLHRYQRDGFAADETLAALHDRLTDFAA